jgi:hypothetical protein
MSLTPPEIPALAMVETGLRCWPGVRAPYPAARKDRSKSALKPLADERRIVKLILHCCG